MEPVAVGTGAVARRQRRALQVRPRHLVLGAAVLWLAMVAIGAAIGPFLASDPAHQDLQASLLGPVWAHGGQLSHPLGTDELGRDQLSRLLTGARVSILVSLAGLLAGGVVGTILGQIAGFFGGVADTVLMRLVDIQLSIPGILLAVTVVTVLGPKVLTVLLVLALYIWVMYARIARGETLSVKTRDYVVAAKALGVGPTGILVKHIFPNIVSSIIVISTLELPNLIIIEAALGYLGLGIPPPTPTLGGMIAAGQQYMTGGDWWLTLFPGAVIALMVLAVNVIGDWLRDWLDPRTKFLQ